MFLLLFVSLFYTSHNLGRRFTSQFILTFLLIFIKYRFRLKNQNSLIVGFYIEIESISETLSFFE